MKKIILLLAVIYGTAPSFGQTKSEEEAVKNTLRAWYDAEAVGDTAQFRALVTPDFYIFEDGTRYNANELLALGKSFLDKGIKPSWTFDPPDVEVDGNAALATFTTHGRFEQGDRHRENTYLESAVFRKENGRWRIAFFHSTPLAKPEDNVPSGSEATPSDRHVAATPAVPTTEADFKAVTDTVRAFYEAERTGNSAGWHALTTPDYFMFHEGIDMSPDWFAKFINDAHQSVLKYNAVWTMDISDLKVSVGYTTALATLTLHSVEDADAPTVKTHPAYDERFLDSFWLRKTPDGWKIVFWNASKVPKPNPNE